MNNTIISLTNDFAGIPKGTDLNATFITQAGAIIDSYNGVTFIPLGLFEVKSSIIPAVPVAPEPAPVATHVAPEPAPVATHVAPEPAPVATPEIKKEQLSTLKNYIDEYKEATKIANPESVAPTATPVAPKPEPTTTPVAPKPEPAATPVAPKPEPAATPVAPKPEPVQKKFVSLKDIVYDFNESGIPNIKIPIYPDEKLTEEEKKLVPTINKNFKWSSELLFSLYYAVFHDANIILTGMPGTGKTDAVKQFAALINRPYVQISGKGDMEGYQIIGQNYSENGNMVWRDGTFTQGFRNGWIIGIHEVFKIPASIMMNLQSAFEKKGTLILDDYPGEAKDRIVTRHQNCSIISTDNTKGLGNDLHMFSAGQIQDTSFLDRMELAVDVNYLPYQIERKLLVEMTRCNPADANSMVQFAKRVRASARSESISLSLSIRGMIAALSLHVDTGLPLKKAVELTVINKYSDDEEISIVQGYATTCFK